MYYKGNNNHNNPNDDNGGGDDLLRWSHASCDTASECFTNSSLSDLRPHTTCSHLDFLSTGVDNRAGVLMLDP